MLRDLQGRVRERLGVIPISPRALHVGLSWQGRVLGVVSLRDMMDHTVVESVRDGVGFDILGDPDKPMMVCDFIQARDPAWVRKPFFAEFDKTASSV